MHGLTEIQEALQNYILQGDMHAHSVIADAGGASVTRRLAIYHSAYRQRLAEALATDFETLAVVLGPRPFRELCEAYIEAVPSRFRNIRWYGAVLPEFLVTAEPWCRHVELAEIARFEWALTLAFDAADRQSLRFEDFARLPADAWGDLRLELHPSLYLIVLRTNAPALRLALEAKRDLPSVERAETPVDWAIWRIDGSPHFRSLAPHERWCIDAVRRGTTFPGLCEGLVNFTGEDEAPALAASLLRTWLEDEWIVSAG